MYQRQILKDGLSSMLVVEQADVENGESSKIKESLSAEQVRDLFNYKHDTLCDTLEMLKVPRCWPDIFGKKDAEVPAYFFPSSFSFWIFFIFQQFANIGLLSCRTLPHPIDVVKQDPEYLEDDLYMFFSM